MSNPTGATGIRSEIVRANERFMDTQQRGDAAGMAALYSENGPVLPPNGDFVGGRQQLQQLWQALMDMGISKYIVI